MICNTCKQDAIRILVIGGNDYCPSCAKVSTTSRTRVDGITTRTRVRHESTMHEGDMIVPHAYNKTTRRLEPNAEFIKRYPDQAKDYFTKDEMIASGHTKLVTHTEKVLARDAAEQAEHQQGVEHHGDPLNALE